MQNNLQAIPTLYKGIWFRSRLEATFASDLDERNIPWHYEPERLGDANYLIDFYLPSQRCWVEVKGVIKEIDRYQLPRVALTLRGKGERLFMYQSNNRAYIIEVGEWNDARPITHSVLWTEIKKPLQLTSNVDLRAETPKLPNSSSPIVWEIEKRHESVNSPASTEINGVSGINFVQYPENSISKPRLIPTHSFSDLRSPIPIQKKSVPQKTSKSFDDIQFPKPIQNKAVSPKPSIWTRLWLIFAIVASLISILLVSMIFLINFQMPIVNSAAVPSLKITYSILTANATATPNTLFIAPLPTPFYISPQSPMSTSAEILQSTALLETPIIVPSFTLTLLPTSTLTPIPSSPTRVPPTETSLPTIPAILSKPTMVDEVEPFVYVVTSSIIIRPAPGNRAQSKGEIQKGNSLVIVGYSYVAQEDIIWWKVKIDARSFGWIVNNLSLINVVFVTFDKNGLPTNVQPVK